MASLKVVADLDASQGLTSRHGCIDIDACHVKLFTNGYKITGNGTGSGIHLWGDVSDIFLEGRGGSGLESSSFTRITGWEYGLRSAAANVISDDFQYNENTVGVFLNGAVNNNINDFGADDNSKYGVWLKNGSNRNQINCANADNNGIAGVYVGCSSTGPNGKTCEEEEDKSRQNYIYDVGATNNGSYGIALERGSRSNIITDTFSRDNGTFDLFDGNQNCDKNLWRVNSFATANQSCIR